MMRNDSKAILDDILSRWHQWSKSYSVVRVAGADPMFRDAKTGRGWDTTDEILDSEINAKIMKAVDFHVDQLSEPFRSAIYILARNCYTGKSVWFSPRLTADPIKRANVISEARHQLTKRLIDAGVM